MIGEVGSQLAEFVQKPLIRAALRMMRQPARLAGFSALHDFLDRGFTAFGNVGDATEFLETIDVRERALMEALLAGEATPFPDPVDPVFAPPPGAEGAG